MAKGVFFIFQSHEIDSIELNWPIHQNQSTCTHSLTFNFKSNVIVFLIRESLGFDREKLDLRKCCSGDVCTLAQWHSGECSTVDRGVLNLSVYHPTILSDNIFNGFK